MPSCTLADRAVVRITGPDARSFLDRLVTCDLDRVAPGQPRFGALLTPQGKILVDFIVHEVTGGDGSEFHIDCPASALADFVKRLTLYRLRAKVSVTDLTGAVDVVVGWSDPPPDEVIAVAPDPRLPALGWRALLPAGTVPADTDRGDYDRHRVALGVPDSERDFALGDAFPHEALMDQLGGVDFDKGCYVGQEVVSRTQHRGTARTRIVLLEIDGEAPATGSAIVAGERTLGTLGSGAGDQALATLRLDRAADALAAGEAITIAGQGVRFAKPDWVRFTYPNEMRASAA